MPGEERTRLAVLYGGRSAEHDISCVSARSVVGAADRRRYDVAVIGVTTDGRWVDATEVAAGLAPGVAALPSPDHLVDVPAAAPGRPAATPPGPLEGLGLLGDPSGVVAVPMLHGPMGEDGTLQGLLELAGVAYTGAGVAGSAAAMDKGLTKALLRAAGLPVCRYVEARRGDDPARLAREVHETLGWPVFVKPANMGSSVGVSRVAGADGLAGAVEHAFEFDEYLLVEEAVAGREVEVAVLGWPDLRASQPGELRPSREFYDFEDKYLAGTAGLIVPAELEPGTVAQLRRSALAACRALRVDGMARVDFFVEEGGRGALLNEVNTIPGFTPISMYPRLWAAEGLAMPALIDALVDQARRRHARRAGFALHRR